MRSFKKSPQICIRTEDEYSDQTAYMSLNKNLIAPVAKLAVYNQVKLQLIILFPLRRMVNGL